ncbi:MAG: hypothetical protein K8H75_13995 [Sulfuricella sp.]|nr:hypothetical protein [Sulfuricella sp.]
MNAIVLTPDWGSPISPEPDRGTCLLCAIVGMLAAAMTLAVLAKMLFLAPAGPTVLPLDETCSLSRETCSVRLPDGGTLKFSIGPHPVPLLQTLTLEIRISDSDAHPVEVGFTGVNVPMAFNRTYPTPATDGAYTAQTTLPLCASGHMVWQASVLLEKGDDRLLVPFRFETERGA